MALIGEWDCPWDSCSLNEECLGVAVVRVGVGAAVAVVAVLMTGRGTRS